MAPPNIRRDNTQPSLEFHFGDADPREARSDIAAAPVIAIFDSLVTGRPIGAATIG
jgi:hypothetical protein